MDNGGKNSTNLYEHALIMLSEYYRRAADPDDAFELNEIQKRIKERDAILLTDIKRFVRLADGLRKGYVRIEEPYY